MKIITWNCNKKFRSKAALIAPHKPDIAVIQECENLYKYPIEGDTQPTNKCHYANVSIGIGIISYTGLDIKTIFEEDTYKKIDVGLCAEIGGKSPFQIVGVWTGPNKIKEYNYVNSISTFINKYRDWILEKDTIILGDFNSNKTYDTKTKKYYEDMSNIFDSINMVSVYHVFPKKIKHGEETEFTHFHHKRDESKFHIDYIYIPRKLLANVKSFTIGKFDEWRHYSDHVPLILEME